MEQVKFSILITTRNRLEELKFTLQESSLLINREDTEVLIYDDASTDGTYDYLKITYPKVKLFRNKKSKGLIHNRNVLLNSCVGKYAISLDDDAYFLTKNPFEIIEEYFINNDNCGVIACRIFWGKEKPMTIQHHEINQRVFGFVGCGHVWKMNDWEQIPNYPSWFVFYGEEEFASYHLFKKNIEIHYVPDILVHHKVNVKNRKKASDYQERTRRSFRSGWYLLWIFSPIEFIPRKLAYTFWIQFKTKMIKGDWKATLAVLQAVFDTVINLPKLVKQSDRLSKEQYVEIKKLTPTKLYWKPEK